MQLNHLPLKEIGCLFLYSNLKYIFKLGLKIRTIEFQ